MPRQPDPQLLADLARARLRAKITVPREAPERRLERMHAPGIGAIRAHIDLLDEQIEQLTGAIAKQIAPLRHGR